MSTDALSEYFRTYEIGKSYTAERLDINNTPPVSVIASAKQLAIHVLDPIREEFGPYSPQSWYRSEELEIAITWEKGFRKWCAQHNKPWLSRKSMALGHPLNELMGVKESWAAYFALKSHPKGQAADIEIVGVSNDDLYFWIKKNLEYDQLIREFPQMNDPKSGWVHVSWKCLQDNRGACFSIPFYDRYA